MTTVTQAATNLRATLNYAGDRTDGGTFSNFDPSQANQSLDPHEVEIRDARQMSPKLDAEGFELHHLPFAGQNLLDEKWVAEVHVPRIQAYVQELTGAAEIHAFQGLRALVRDTGKFTPGYSIAAEFVHIDQTRTSPLPLIGRVCPPGIAERYPHIRIYNVWRPQTPPPQTVPLAISDQRTIDPADWVEARAVEPGHEGYTPYLTLAYNPAQRWHYFADMTPEEMIVFKAWDSDPAYPIGCAHGAFRNSAVPAGTTPRISAEFRFICFFES